MGGTSRGQCCVKIRRKRFRQRVSHKWRFGGLRRTRTNNDGGDQTAITQEASTTKTQQKETTTRLEKQSVYATGAPA